MKKIVKLTERDLQNIVKKVLSEQGNMFGTAGTNISGYRKDDSRNKQKPVSKKENINPKNLKLGDGGKKDPKKSEDVKVLQKKLMDLKLLKTDTMIPTGYFGDLTQKALDAYNSQSTGQNQSNTSKVKSSAGFVMIFAFPAYKPALEKGDTFSDAYAKVVQFFSGDKPEKFPPMGHGGCVVIDVDGSTSLYEFGRYDGRSSSAMGLVKSKNLGKIAKIKNGVLENAQQVASVAKKNTQGEGPRLSMTVVVFDLPNPQGAKSYASVKERKYQILDMDADDEESNCGTFALKVAQAGGVDVPEYCFPAPAAMVQQLRLSADDYFTV